MKFNIDNLFRTKLNEINYDFKPEYWEEMEQMIEKEGAAGISGGGGRDHGVVIDKKTGAVSLTAPLIDSDGNPTQDMEGLTVYNHKYFYGTTGVEFPDLKTDNTLYRIEKATGRTEAVTRLDRTVKGYEPFDIEAISCLPVCK